MFLLFLGQWLYWLIPPKRSPVDHFLPPAYLQVPDAGGVEEGGVHLPHPADVSHVPHVQTVVVIDAAEPAAHRVVSHGDGVRETGVRFGAKQVADGKEMWNNGNRCLIINSHM